MQHSPLAVLLGRGQKSIGECREILGLIKDHSPYLALQDSSLAARSGCRELETSLTKHLAEPSQKNTRCEMYAEFVPQFSYIRQAENH
jgi:hypothetical protein